MRKRILSIVILSMLFICGCRSEEKVMPEQSPKAVLQLYLEAIKKQDGMVMADHTSDQSGVDFTISEEDAKVWGLNKDSMWKLYAQLLNFTYTCDEAVVNETKAEIKIHVQAYDLSEVLTDIVSKQEETFQAINGDDLSEADKNQKIADIIIEEFQNAERSKSFDMTMRLQLVDNKWLIESQDGEKLLEQLFVMKAAQAE
ncbi:hypothetical protein D5266_04355 [bacterium c-19]|nr:hypothetical protein [bacterium c-19]